HACDTTKYLPMIQLGCEPAKTQLGERISQYSHNLSIGHRRVRANNIDIGLPKLTVTPTRRPLAAIGLADRIAPPWQDELALVLGYNPCQWHGLVVAQCDFIAAVGLKTVDQLLIITDLTFQRSRILDQRRL